MPSDVEIANAALYEVGDKAITTLTDDSDRARAVNGLFAFTRDAILRVHPWNFALARKVLARDATGPTFGFAYSYTLPSDPYCLRVWKTDWVSGDPTWKVEGRKIVTDAGAVSILYIARIEDPEQFDTLFTDAFIARLGARVAIPITGNRTLAEDLWRLYLLRVQEARSIDGQEGRPDQFSAPHLTEVR